MQVPISQSSWIHFATLLWKGMPRNFLDVNKCNLGCDTRRFPGNKRQSMSG